jgi:GDP-L-fucose synthase
MLARVVDYVGELRFNACFPDGTPRKLLDISRLTALGWQPKIGLQQGLESTYAWYCQHEAAGGSVRRSNCETDAPVKR